LLLEIKKFEFTISKKKSVKQLLSPVRRHIKGNTKRYAISRIYIIPDTDYSFEKYLTLSINPTDDFLLSVKKKIQQVFADTYNKKSIYYKIEREKADKNVEYLLSVITIDPLFQKSVEKSLSLSRQIRVQWMPYYYSLNKVNYPHPDPEMDSLIIHVAKNYTDLIIVADSQIQFVKRVTFSLPMIEAVLTKDHFSQNQVRNAIDIDLDFNSYDSFQRGISFKMLVDNFLKDINRVIQVYQSTFSRNIDEIVIKTDNFQKNNLAELLAKQTGIQSRYHKNNTEINPVSENQIAQLAPSDIELLIGVIHADKRGDLFLPIRAKNPGFRHALKQKLSLTFLIDNPWKKLIVGLLCVLVIFASANAYCSKLYERSTKNLYSIKNKLGRVRNKFSDSIDSSKEIAEYKDLIADVNVSNKIIKQSAKVLRLIYRKRGESINVVNVIFDSRQSKFEIFGETTSIEDVNRYLELIGQELIGVELNVNRIEKISARRYSFHIDINLSSMKAED